MTLPHRILVWLALSTLLLSAAPAAPARAYPQATQSAAADPALEATRTPSLRESLVPGLPRQAGAVRAAARPSGLGGSPGLGLAAARTAAAQAPQPLAGPVLGMPGPDAAGDFHLPPGTLEGSPPGADLTNRLPANREAPPLPAARALAANAEAPPPVFVDSPSSLIDGVTTSVADLIADPGPDGAISFPEALAAVNNSGPGFTIRFDLPGGTVLHAAPAGGWKLQASYTTIDGDMNGDGRPDVVIDTVEEHWGLAVYSDHNIIRHLVIQGLGFQYDTAHHNLVTRSYLGTDISGRVAAGKENDGVEMRLGAHDNTIEKSVIAGNGGSDDSFGSAGVMIWGGAHDNVLRGNRIGASAGDAALPNEFGVVLYTSLAAGGASGNLIGENAGQQRASSACSGPCNIISGNRYSGVVITGTLSLSNTVAGNYIGAAITGTLPMPNGNFGVAVRNGASFNRIGGDRGAARACLGSCNVISGNALDGVILDGALTQRNIVAGNYIGLSASGTYTVPNAFAGVRVQNGAHDNLLGGARSLARCSGPCNAIAGNGGHGVELTGDATRLNRLEGNFIGVAPSGTAMPNTYSGVVLSSGAVRNQIGGVRPSDSAECSGPCNVISGNERSGVLLRDTGTLSNTIQGNFIGVSPAGWSPLANGGAGVTFYEGTSENLLGGTRAGTVCGGPCNVIAGNVEDGVALTGTGVLSNTVQGNHIGTDPSGMVPLSNWRSGIRIHGGATGTLVGGVRPAGPCSGPCNLIRSNGEAGVAVTGNTSLRNTVRGNSIYGNLGLGIDLAGDGASENDAGDLDAGPNDLLNYPYRAVAEVDAGITRITGAISMTLPALATVELFASKELDPTGHGEGQTLLGAVTPSILGQFSLDLPGRLPFRHLSATVTDLLGNTSEFSHADTDGDELYDDWELYGTALNGVQIDLPTMGADPSHKDLFVHADWMAGAGIKPAPRDLAMVVNAFGRAPVRNADGKPGIYLHVDGGSDTIMDPVKRVPWGIRSRAGELPYAPTVGSFAAPNYDWTDADNLKALKFLPSGRNKVFHWACFCSSLGGLGSVSGIARTIPGADFLVTLGAWPGPGGTSLQKAGTFMHELGHDLGLRHGGFDDDNFKPNYLSVMNYSFQMPGLTLRGGGPRSLDYSRRTLPTLDEQALNESAGIADPDGHNTYWKPLTGSCFLNKSTYYKSLPSPQLDWNCDGALTAASVVRDVNGEMCIDPGPNLLLDSVPLSDDILVGESLYDGPNRVCDSAKGGDDVQVRPKGAGQQRELRGFEDWPAVRLDGGSRIGRAAAPRLPGSSDELAGTAPSDYSTYELIRDSVPPVILEAEAHAPVDVTSFSFSSNHLPLTVNFDGSASYDPDGTVVAWEWDFGDGTTGSGPHVSHDYWGTDTTYAFLTVTDNDGNTNLVPLLIWITPGSPLSAVTLGAPSIIGGKAASGLVTLARPARPGDETVALSSSHPAIAPVPGSLTIWAGDPERSFTIYTNPVAEDTPVTITAEMYGVTRTAELLVRPASLSAASLADGQCAARGADEAMRATGGFAILLEVTLDGPAPPGGAVVVLASSDGSLASVPATLTIPEGEANWMAFVHTTQVNSERVLTISATYRGHQEADTLILVPASGYTVIDLGDMRAAALNDKGEVVGSRVVAGEADHTVLWQAGQTTDLGIVGAASRPNGIVRDLDGAGHLVGSAGPGPDTQPFYRGTVVELLALPAPYQRGSANRIGDGGDVAGVMDSASPPGHRGFRWSLGTAQELPPLASYTDSDATDVNAAGLVVGYSWKVAGYYFAAQATKWGSDGVPVSLGSVGGMTSEALAVNDVGQVALAIPGRFSGGLPAPYLWQDGTFTPLPLPLGYRQAAPARMNNQGQIIGTMETSGEGGGETRTLFYDGKEIVDGQCLLPPGSPWQLTELMDINDAGQIVARGLRGGQAGSLLINPPVSVQQPAPIRKIYLPMVGRS